MPAASQGSVAGAFYMYFILREGWHCQFLEADLKTPLPKKLNLSSSQKVIEAAERGSYNIRCPRTNLPRFASARMTPMNESLGSIGR